MLKGRQGRKGGWEGPYPDVTHALQAHFVLIVFAYLFADNFKRMRKASTLGGVLRLTRNSGFFISLSWSEKEDFVLALLLYLFIY